MRNFVSAIIILLIISFSNSVYSQSNCANAVNIPLDVYGSCGDMFFTNVDFDGAVTSSDLPAPTCGSFGGTTNDMWYTFQVPTGVTELAFHAFNAVTPMMAIPPLIPGAPACGPGMAIYRGTCGSLTLIDCFNESDGFLQNGEIRWEVLGMTPGETIYVRIWEEDNDVTSLFFAASVITSLPESDCNNPPELGTAGCNILAPGGTIQAPDDCGWTSTDNVVFYSFEVLPGDPQPVTIEIEYGECWANEVGGMFPTDPEIQFAVYSWNGTNCTGIGGSPLSDPPNSTTYQGCENGTGTVIYSQNLAPGLYVLAMDGFSFEGGNSLCTFGIAASFIDPDPEELSVTLSTVDNGCGQTGSATITVNSSCATNPTINWSNSQTGTSITNLAAGNYSVTVTDDAPCGDTVINFTIADNSTFVVSVTSSGSACGGPVTLVANVMGANPGDVSFAWNTSPAQFSQSIVVTDGGTYSVTATYGTCVDSDDITIVSGDFDLNVVYTASICEGGSGSAGINIIVGTGPYMYEWSTGSIAPGISFTSGGNYCVTVTDLYSSCQITECFTVTVNPAVIVTIDPEDISCYGKVDGSATAVVSGGAEPYDYMWSTFIAAESIYNLISGNYAVTVEDANGCTGTASVFIAEPAQFFYNITPNQGICAGEQANIDVTVTGGVEPYLYTWNDAPDMNSGNRIVSPTVTTQYTVTVYDDNLCTYTPQTTTVTVSQPIIIDVETVDLLCHGVCDGSATLNITGGIAPFQYSWGSTTDYYPNLCAGDYELTITDLFGCTGDAHFTLTQPDTVYLTVVSGPATCWGYNDGFVEVDAVGGVPFVNEFGPFYQYTWSGGQTQDSIAVGFGFHAVTVTDANGCQYVATAFVDQPEAVYVTEPWGGTICIGETFSTFVHATGGMGPYDFVWMGNDGSYWYGEHLTVSPIVTTSYTLVTTDFRGCFGPVKNVTVNVHPIISIMATTVTPEEICVGESVLVEMEIDGGNGGPYTINMEDVGVVNMPKTFYPQETGYYVFNVSDDCGSPGDSDSVYVEVHPLPHAAFYADKTASCPPGVFQFTETTADFGQTYLWDFGDGGFSVQKNPSHTYNTSGTYSVSLTAWSEYGCKKTIKYNNMIFIYPLPRAEFAATPELVSVLNGQVEFVNYSEGGITYFWDFGDGYSSMWTENMQIHNYTEVGEYDITMIAKNQYECLDTAFKKVRVHDEFAFYAPSAFTPNGDGINDIFHIFGHGISDKDFYLVIYDRYGMKVFETSTYDEENPYRMAWDGSHNGNVLKGDPILTNGMYRWYCTFVDFIGKPHEESGTVTLIK
ncbi:MAG TPA: PKD domain-containing protein [Bacteroidales bacterium]|nr:PKD domain-containing protein [Bacteroidales bacterium]